MAMRRRYGMRRHIAKFSEHDGRKDAHGQPDLEDPAAWVVVLPDYPCELITTVGGETIRGRQVTARTSHVAFGDFAAAKDLKPQMRAEIAGVTYELVAAYDAEGLSMEQRIELRREI